MYLFMFMMLPQTLFNKCPKFPVIFKPLNPALSFISPFWFCTSTFKNPQCSSNALNMSYFFFTFLIRKSTTDDADVGLCWFYDKFHIFLYAFYRTVSIRNTFLSNR